MTSPYLEYLAAQEELLRLRALDLTTRDVEDEYADRLESLWWQLSSQDRDAVEAYFMPPEVTDEHALDDVEDVDAREGRFPRRKAA